MAIAVGLLAAAVRAGGQGAASPAGLTVGGDVPVPLTLTVSDLKAMPRTTTTVKQENGTSVTYEGVLLSEILRRAGAPLGRELSGNAVASYILATAADGYQAAFALAEADPQFTGSEILVADTVDGKPLFDYQGPLRLVAPHDKRGARSVRMLQRIDVVRLRK
jgi:DMSO/TMAO reductase YedYZ molybdopterin-dependent catalytic subunit